MDRCGKLNLVDDLISNFSLAIRISGVVAGAAAVLVLRILINGSKSGPSPIRSVARVLASSFAIIALVATSVRGRSLVFESGGDLVLVPGGAGLGDFSQLAADPTSLAAILLAGNALLYIPVAFAAVVGWYSHRRYVLAGCLVLSLTVETFQFAALGRVAAIDDVILNMTGAAIGYGIATWAVRHEVIVSVPVDQA
jgi:hypothetical protein